MQIRTLKQHRQQEILISLVKKIEKEVNFRKEHNIVPVRASWRALRDTLTQEEWDMLDAMVQFGVIKKYDGIKYPSYEVVYRELARYEREYYKK